MEGISSCAKAGHRFGVPGRRYACHSAYGWREKPLLPGAWIGKRGHLYRHISVDCPHERSGGLPQSPWGKSRSSPCRNECSGDRYPFGQLHPWGSQIFIPVPRATKI